MRLFRALVTLAIASVLWALSIWLTGGFTITIAGTRITSTTPWRPLTLFALASAALLIVYGPRAVMGAIRNAARGRHSRRLAVCLAVALALAGVRWGTWTASGPDPYAYVSQAAMWRAGAEHISVPLAAEAPWPQPVATFTPFGYRAAPDGSATLVPMTTPGLPLAMAALQAVLGHWAAFLIAPIAAAALVILTFRIARRVQSERAGAVAACFVATSPIVIFMTLWPMTDVPAAACSALMIDLLLARTTPRTALAGLAASAGLLLRPTFALIAAAAALWLVTDWCVGRTFRSAVGAGPKGPAYVPAVVFLAACLPGVLVLFWVNVRWFGSPLTFGYGTAGQLLSFSRTGVNAAHYSRWLIETSPLGFAGLLALAAALLRPSFGGLARREALLLAAVAAAAIAPYLLYEPFDDWWYLRFLLPAWPALFVAAAAWLSALWARGRAAAAAVTLVTIVAGAAGLVTAERRGVFQLNERRYATIARIVSGMTDPSAVILTVQHAGTIRYYAGRQTLRWDLVDPAWLDRAIEWLAARGRHPYLLIEDWEEAQFDARFGPSNRSGRLSYSPVMAWQSRRADGWIYLFDPLNRDAQTITPGLDVELAEPFTASPAAEPWPK